MIPDESACLYNGLHAGGMSAPPSQPPSLSQRLTMWQKRSAVRSASYSAECASPCFHSSPAACAARANTVWPKARPPSVAVSKVLKGRKGLRLMPLRVTAALMKARSKEGLWPSRMARVHSASRTARCLGCFFCCCVLCLVCVFCLGCLVLFLVLVCV